MKITTPSTRQTGFTLIELLIATTVFSVVLLLCMAAILQIGRTYYKGITASQTQETARSVMDEISRAIQFDGGVVTTTPAPAPGTNQRFCVGDTRFSYVLDRQLIDGGGNSALQQGPHALVTDNFPGCTSSSAQNLSSAVLASGSRELLSPRMRLAKLQITQISSTNLYQVDIKVVFGDSDLLNATHDGCSGGPGGQFCAASELSTVVQKRVK